MRLKSIRLSGFKSFVDPTSIPLPSSRVAIVGPNGCGKSNIIDAVRWVIGESAARHLRGESMADVIFNGSANRAPVAMAMVELLFDNQEGRLGGEYARYPEISIKRQVSREGQSVYLLNGVRCRRKDIIDLFLGTGVSPRGYAIIEQGAISRIVEARPQDLRELLEEAAGVSRYKERRHETELRIRHTRENLDRLHDLCQEVGTQLNQLKRQAAKAERYVALKAEERHCRDLSLALRWARLDQSCRRQEDENARLAGELARLQRQSLEAQERLGALREDVRRRQAELNEGQGRYYALGAEISRLEQTLQQAEMQREQRAEERARLVRELAEVEGLRAEDQARLAAAREELEAVGLQLDEAEILCQEAEGRLQEGAAEEAEAHRNWRDASAQSARAVEELRVLEETLRRLRDQAAQLAARRQKLAAERQRLLGEADDGEIPALESVLAELEAERVDLRGRLEALSARLDALAAAERADRDRLHALRTALQKADGEIAALETLQRHAIGKDKLGRERWVSTLPQPPACRLAEQIQVQSGWEAAVERVLGEHLEALCFDAPDTNLPHHLATSEETVAYSVAGGCGCDEDSPRLCGRIRSPWRLPGWLHGIHCAEDLDAALRLLPTLPQSEAVVTRDGLLLGEGWGIASRGADPRLGVLQRESSLRELRVQRGRDAEEIEAVLTAQRTREGEQGAALESRRQLQQEEQRAADRAAGVAAELSAARARAEQHRQRLRWLDDEMEDLRLLDEEVRLALEQAEGQRAVAEARVEETERLLREAAEAQEAVRVAGQQRAHSAREASERVRALETRAERLKAALESTGQQLERVEARAALLQGRLEAVAEAQAALPEPVGERTALERRREERRAAETDLARLREALEQAEQDLGRGMEADLGLAREADRLKQQRDQVLLALQGDLARLETVRDEITRRELEVAAALADPALETEGDEGVWQSRADALLRQVDQLGPVNLAAMEDYQVQAERKAYLDQQHQDLTDALASLEKAIQKIDRESRALFRDTFARVNAGFERCFTQLFGGGKAWLEVAESETDEGGVSITARPPGKRNSSIHLLSGGEKALTAVALVFAIFELNPAPFCLLDEVDAPLDEANVGRFGQLVKEMSERVQFLIITHNKATMEIAEHLTGVTMKEPGVSRVVAVDIERAIRLAGQ